MIDYAFYSETYKGDVVSEPDFPKALMRAQNILDKLTYCSIVENDGAYGQMVRGEFQEFTAKELEALKYALCGLVDTIGNLDAAEGRALAGNNAAENVASRSSGGESISFNVAKTAYDVALSDEKAKYRLYLDAVKAYATPTMFRINPFYAGWG